MNVAGFISEISVRLHESQVYIYSGDIYMAGSLDIGIVIPSDRYLFGWNPYCSGRYLLGFLSEDRGGGDIYSIETNEWIDSFHKFQLDSFDDFSFLPVIENGDCVYHVMSSTDRPSIAITSAPFRGDGYLLTCFKDRSGGRRASRKRNTEITFRTLDLNVVWRNSDYQWVLYRPDGDQRFSHIYDLNSLLCIDGGDVIFSLDKSNGKEIWNFSGENSRIRSNNLIKNDLILFMGLSTVYLLNPDNGDVINHIDFEKTHNYLAAEYDGEYIYIFLNDTPQILVYDKTGTRLINRIEIPEPYQFMALDVPHLVDGVLYASLNCATRTYNALMTVTKDELLGKAPLTIEYEKRPDTQVECVKNPDDSDHYVVTVNSDPGDRADWVFRYAGVAAMDVVAKYGSAPVPSPDLNQDFNGLIKIRIGGLPAEERTDDFLERLAFQVTKSAVDQHHRAGIHKIRAECEWI